MKRQALFSQRLRGGDARFARAGRGRRGRHVQSPLGQERVQFRGDAIGSAALAEFEPAPGRHRQCGPTGRRLSQSDSHARSGGRREAKGELAIAGKGFPNAQDQCRAIAPPFTLAMRLGLADAARRRTAIITIIYDQNANVRHIRMNGAHPANLMPSPMGDSGRPLGRRDAGDRHRRASRWTALPRSIASARRRARQCMWSNATG